MHVSHIGILVCVWDTHHNCRRSVRLQRFVTWWEITFWFSLQWGHSNRSYLSITRTDMKGWDFYYLTDIIMEQQVSLTMMERLQYVFRNKRPSNRPYCLFCSILGGYQNPNAESIIGKFNENDCFVSHLWGNFVHMMGTKLHAHCIYT